MAEPVTEKQSSGDANDHDVLPSTMQHEVPHPTSVSFFRGTLFQTLVVGLASFLAPGMYAALSATGAGGLANVRTDRPSLARRARRIPANTRSKSVTRPWPLLTP